MKKRLDILPAWDKRDPDPKKNYGIHGVEMRFYIIGDKGAVQFVLFTNWFLPEKADDFFSYRSPFGEKIIGPLPADLGYHSKVPHYEGQESYGYCDLLKCDCYYDGSGLQAYRIFDVLVREGDNGVWRELDLYYRNIFDESPGELQPEDYDIHKIKKVERKIEVV